MFAIAYVTIPKDLSRIQSKVLFGLTKRQVICFGAAALVGVPLFFLAKSSLGTTTAALCMILVILSEGWREIDRIFRASLKEQPEDEAEPIALPDFTEGQTIPSSTPMWTRTARPSRNGKPALPIKRH